ncbi:NET1-associated nuclear protein 1 [Marasmius crinis-equi]|uniref:NET1-associated nuclear protein 1 n=1 Tax=Marasmius crinis-equi TaxID=585013 RepID=A0ABR3F2P2_9AGAR
MAASTSRQPHEIPLPPSPDATNTKNKKSKGKGKENTSQKRRVGKPLSTSRSSEDDLESESKWDWVSLTDPCTSKVPPIFTKDGSYYFSLVGISVKIFSTHTGKLVSTLSAPRTTTESPSDVLTCAVINPHNTFQLITGSSNGCLAFWDYMDAVLLKRIDIGQPIHHICAHEKVQDHLFVSATRNTRYKKTGAEENAVVLRLSLKSPNDASHSPIQKPSEILPVGKTRFPTGLSLSPSGEWIVATAGNKAYVASVASLQSGFTKYVASDRLTCLAFHPTEDYFATGDVKGNIKLWYCLNENALVKIKRTEKKTQTANLHWHAHAVSSLTFTPNGAYLLSGGEEAVLVIWQLHSGKKEFVPRVGAPIQTISLSPAGPHGEEYLLGLSDATHTFVSAANLRISRSYSRMKLGPSMTYNLPSSSSSVPLAIHSITSTIILPSSHPSSLQTYSPSHAEVRSEIEVSPSNRVSRKDDKPLEPSRVRRVVVSPSGMWMASIDSRIGDADFQSEIYLKFWFWDKKTSTWTLNTRIDRPHGLGDVTDLSFSPRSNSNDESYLVTAGSDGTVKTWRTRPHISKRSLLEEFWISRSSLPFRAKAPSSVAWSPDGTLLAVCLGEQVSVYDPRTNVLRCTLTSPESTLTKTAHFLGRGRFLAVVGESEVAVWDIVLQTVRWTRATKSPITSLVPHPDNDTFALFTSTSGTGSRVSIFSATESSPKRSLSLPFSLRNLIWYSPRYTSSFNLLGVTNDWMVIRFGEDVKDLEVEGTTAQEIKASAYERRTLFQDIFGASIFANASGTTPSVPSASTSVWTGVGSSSILDAPAHLMPPLDTMYAPLMDTFLKPRAERVSAVLPEGAVDEDVDMEEDDDVTPDSKRRFNTSKDTENDMRAFVELFKAHSITRTPGTKASKMNGTAKAKKMNGVHPTPSPAPHQHSSTPKPAKSLVSSTIESSPPTISPATNPKKRKKAVDFL